MNCEEIKKENKRLHESVVSYEHDLREITSLLVQVVKGIGIEPSDLQDKDPRAVKRKIFNAIPNIMSDMMTDPDGLEERFSFIKKFEPIFQKHKDLIKDITNG